MNLPIKRIFLLLLPLLCIIMPGASIAQSRVIIDYDYDEAGNIIRIEEIQSLGPPSVSNLTPSIVRIGRETQISASGTNLKLADVTTDASNVIITPVDSELGEIVFNVLANEGAPIGPITLTFTTRQGSDTAQLQIRPTLASISLFSIPVAASPGESVDMLVEISNPDTIDQILTLSTSDTSVATVSPATATVVAGTTLPTETISVTGVSAGVTTLTLSSSELEDVSVTVFVTEPVSLPAGENMFFGKPVGILKGEDSIPESVNISPIIGSLSVLKEFAPPEPQASIVDVRAPSLGIIQGASVIEINPRGYVASVGPTVATVTGRGLDQVTSVEIIPPEDVTVGTFTPIPGGESGTFSIDVADNATSGTREVIVRNALGRLPNATPESNRIFIASEIPQIVSIEPVVLTRLTPSAVVLVRGMSLYPVESITITPNDGIFIGAPTSTGDGLNVTVPVTVAENAALGSRLVQVTTPAGTTSSVLSVENRLEIVNGPVRTFEQFFAPNVGVLKGEPTVPDVEVSPIVTSLGVSVGTVLTDVLPESGVIGTDITLTLLGSELSGVTDVQLIPDDGLTVGAINPAINGDSVEVQLSIAVDAPKTTREVRVLDNSVVVLASRDQGSRFRVTAPVPVLDGVSPNFVVAGALATEHLLLGRNFSADATVRVSPPDGLSVGTTTVASDGRSLLVNLSADVGTALGDRVMVVETPAGATNATSSPNNRLTVTTGVLANFSPIAAPLIGVNKMVLDVPVATTDFSFAPLVGVTIGAYIEGLTPSGALVDSSLDLIVGGQALDGVTSVVFEPADGLTIDGPLVVSPDGTELRVPITVDLTAPRTIRQVLVFDGIERVEPASPTADRLSVVTVPTIDSIEPIAEQPGAGFTLTVRGIDFSGVTAVIAEPAQGIVFGNNLTLSPDGTELTIDMGIDPDAALGNRVIRLVTPAGTTPSNPTSENTFEVVP